LVTLVGMIMKTRSQRASGLAYLMGIFLTCSGVPGDVVKAFNKLGLSVGPDSLGTWFKKLHLERKKEIYDEVPCCCLFINLV